MQYMYQLRNYALGARTGCRSVGRSVELGAAVAAANVARNVGRYGARIRRARVGSSASPSCAGVGRLAHLAAALVGAACPSKRTDVGWSARPDPAERSSLRTFAASEVGRRAGLVVFGWTGFQACGADRQVGGLTDRDAVGLQGIDEGVEEEPAVPRLLGAVGSRWPLVTRRRSRLGRGRANPRSLCPPREIQDCSRHQTSHHFRRKRGIRFTASAVRTGSVDFSTTILCP